MAPFRPHVSLATAALILVVPVVVGVIIGGFNAGVVSVIAGFVVFDYAFVPPYHTLSVGNAQNWVALAVYAVVMLLVARVVTGLVTARADAVDRTAEAGRLFALSELLVKEGTVDELLRTIVQAVATAFEVPGVTLLVLRAERLEVAATAGQSLFPEELRRLDPRSGVPVSLGTASRSGSPDSIQTVALTASGRPVGILAIKGMPAREADRALLRTFANHAALALERAQLRDQAMRSELLEEVDRLRHALLGAVSHDLRTPLATMKVASSTLLSPPNPLADADLHELYGLIDVETDRLTRLVTSLLDMTRIDAGVLVARPTSTPVRSVIEETVAAVGSQLNEHTIVIDLADDLPDVRVDRLLIGQVLANLIDNADRHAPPHTVITVAAEAHGDRVAVSVADAGAGVPTHERDAIFDRYVRYDTGGRAGLGLTIARTFVEAHGQRIWVEDSPVGGARFVFTLDPMSAVPVLAADADPAR
jgi:two-component system sensor histidine kinase KdpD